MVAPTRPPRFSIVIPNYNREEFVGLAIDSVLAQTFADYELIVVDDGSTDGAVAVIRGYGPRLRLICQENRGAEVARTTGVMAACGEYVVLLDNDDLLQPFALATYDHLIRTLHEPPVLLAAVSLIHDRAALPPPDAPIIEYLQFADYLSRDVPVSLTCSQLVLKRTQAIADGAFRPGPTAFPFDIPDMMLRLGTSGPFIITLRPRTVAYRQHAANTVKRVDYMIGAAAVLARLERSGQYPGGAARRFDRYACIGTMALFWTFKALKRRRLLAAARLLWLSAPMVFAGLIKRAARGLRNPTPVRRLHPAA